MAGYHAIDGVPCSANQWLLKDVLKKEWNFKGIVLTDWDNVGHMHRTQRTAATMEEACKIALEAGNDMIMSTPEFYHNTIDLVRKGILDEELIHHACSRILYLKFKLGLFDDKRFPDTRQSSVIIGCDDHKELAYQSALESIVLLKNKNQVLPLSKDVKTIALIGPNCDDVQAQLGDWSFGARDLAKPEVPTLDYHPEYDPSPIVTLLEGMKKRVGKDIHLLYNKGCDLIDENIQSIDDAVKIAKQSDVIIAVVGDSNILNGESRDRVELNLTGAQQNLLEALKDTGRPLVVVLINGRPLTIPWIKEHADALLEAWNPGMEGGNAIASILFGDYNPSGKLTISFPRHIGQQPVFYNQLPGWHGDKYIEMNTEPLFPFGFGLSYTQFKYSNLQLSSDQLTTEDTLMVSVDIQNVGDYAGDEIVQLYIQDLFSSVTTPLKELKGFKKISLQPGEKRNIQFTLPITSLALINQKCETVIEPGEFEIMIGSSSRDEDLLKKTIEVIEIAQKDK